MYKANTPTGLFPTQWNIESGTPISGQLIISPFLLSLHLTPFSLAHYSVGAYADSAHEYLLKQYLLTGRSEPQILELCTLPTTPP